MVIHGILRACLPLVLLGATTSLPSSRAADLSIHRAANQLRLDWSGQPGKVYRLESSPSLPGSWTLRSEWTQTDPVFSWIETGLESKQFFRVVTWENPLGPAAADNFRLIDHTGRSQELFYHSNVKGIVLIFTGNNCRTLQDLVPEIRALRELHPDVPFWMVNSSPSATRESLAADAAVLGLALPILHDDAQLATRAYAVSAAPEFVCLRVADWTVAYRGAFDNRGSTGGAPTRQYLADALEALKSGAKLTILQTAASGCTLDLPPARTISYANEVAPILREHCVRCHSPGNIAPFAMTNYSVVEAWSWQMRHEVLSGEMPPWHADPHYGEFANDLGLSPAEKATLIQWIDSGSPRGEGPDPLAESIPPPPADWPLGPPDYIVTIPTEQIPSGGVLDYRYPFVVNPIPRDVWLRAAVVRPGNRRVVHHCLVFAGTLLDVLNFQGGLKGYFAGYVPGVEPVAFPQGTGKFLAAGSFLIFQMHYTTTGQEETDATQLGLYVHDAKPALELKTGSAYTTSLNIPPGANDYERQAEFRFSKAAWIYEMSPHMHYRGARFRYEAIYPDGSRETLLSVPNYRFEWQTLYRFAEPKRMPAGTRLLCIGAFDNSTLNPYNPDPTATVTFGEQTFDEMFIGYFNYAEGP